MRLIIGGVCQGKYEYAGQAYPDSKIVNGLHEMIRDEIYKKVSEGQFANGADKTAALQKQIEDEWVERVLSWEQEGICLCVICNEIGMGIVPMEKWERVYREVVGHVCIRLAEEAESVERVICGCVQKIKG